MENAPLPYAQPYRHPSEVLGWTPPRPPPARRAFRPVEIGAALGITALVDLTVWARGGLAVGGLGLAVFFLALPALALASVRAWRVSGRLAAIALLLLCVVVRCAIAPTVGVTLAGLALLLAFVLALRAPRLGVPDLALSGLLGSVKLPARFAAFGLGVKKVARRTQLGRVSLLPIVVPAALVALFVGVFALANPLVAHGLGTVGDLLARLVTLPPAGRVLLWVFALTLGLGVLRPTFKRTARRDDAPCVGEATPTSLSVARNALVGLNVVFLAYNALDAVYLWSGRPPEGMHTQQYAHQGAFWLTVALVLLTAVIGVLFRGALAHDPRANAPRRLAFAWTAQGIVLALGTYGRIAIHIAKSGLSDLRIVGILGTSLVVCGVVLVAWKLRHGRSFGWLVRRQLDAFALTTILYAVAPTHLLSARVNVERVRSGEYRPILHAFRQSHETESAATYLPLLDHPDVRIRQGVAALLADERSRLRHDAEAQRTWRERDLATARALVALDGARHEIDQALGGADPIDARRVLLEISRVANEDRSIEELLAVPAARGDASERL